MTDATSPLLGQTLTVTHGEIHPGMRGAVTLRPVTTTGQMTSNPKATGVVVLPKVRMLGYGGGSGGVTLPKVTVGGGMTIPNLARAALTLPTPTLTMSMIVGGMASAALLLSALRVSSRTGGASQLTLGKLLVAGTATAQESATAALTLPKVTGSGTGFRWSEVASAHLVLPKVISGESGHAMIVLPRIAAVGIASNAGSVNTPVAWAMNIRTGAMTQFTNFPFRAFVCFQNKYYGIGLAGGLYLLDGDTDYASPDPTPIPWAFETGLNDMDNPAQKGVLGVYVDGVVEKGAELTVVTDTRARYAYTMYERSNHDDHRPYRVLTGRGIRTRNIGIAMSSTVGGYVEVDQIAPEYVISKRSI